MNHGFYKVASITPKIKVGDVAYNTECIIKDIEAAASSGVSVAVFSELCISGYSLGDLFLNQTILDASLKGLNAIAESTSTQNMLVVVGLPYQHRNILYNVLAVIYQGNILGMIPKQFLPNYREHFEMRHFGYDPSVRKTFINGKTIPFHPNILFENTYDKNFVLAVEVCEALWVPNSPSIDHALAGATLIANGSAGIEVVGKAHYRRDLIKIQSAKLNVGYIYASSGLGESTTDAIYAGHNLIYENGILLAESELFTDSMIISDIDVEALMLQRRLQNTFTNNSENHETVYFNHIPVASPLIRELNPTPFIANTREERNERSELILDIQAHALVRRFKQIKAKTLVVGLSGGLDSTLALIACVKACEILGLDFKNIITITMPGFGTTSKTYDNALKLAKSFNTTLLEIPIRDSVLQHFKDIHHDPNVHDLAYENAQARMRTQILMNTAQKYDGFVVGTGNLSELALGWTTYNGDHMSMYGINSSIPKTLVYHIVEYYAKMCDPTLKETIMNVLNTPISPELLPPNVDGEVSQVTEAIVGPYELHDYFLYHFIASGFTPVKIRYLAGLAFIDKYNQKTIDRWLLTFMKRFFTQQYKRSALPDGPRIGSVNLSPRTGFRMPSDVLYRGWISELEALILNDNT